MFIRRYILTCLIMNLKHLLKQLTQIDPQSDCDIQAVTADSRLVKAGALFLAFPGLTVDGRQFIEQAIQQGAAAVLYEGADDAAVTISQQAYPVPVIAIKQLAQHVGEIAARFYHQPSQQMHVIGVTGTNGKTSCCHFIAEALAQLDQRCALLGTNGSGFLPSLVPATHTTPDPVQLQALLADFVKQKADYLAMEVSSHALDQVRVGGIQFDTAVFTQLSRDHLDYHGTMENYAKAKKRLFSYPDLKHVILNIDDPLGLEIAEELSQKKQAPKIWVYSAKGQQDKRWDGVRAMQVKAEDSGFTVAISSPWGEAEFFTPLLGRFNIDNLFAVLLVLLTHQVSLTEAIPLLEKLQPIAGRMQTLGGGKQPLVVVDFAHTPDALKQTLMALKQHQPQKLICVFGCGGDRDQGKRPLMGVQAEQYADQVIITNDNPRSEDPQQISAAILQGCKAPDKVLIELDRKKAIQLALKQTKAGDIVLIAGKGHENYQLIGDNKIAFSDVEQVKACLNA